MPLVAYNDLPTFQRLKEEGRTVLSAQRAQTQEIRQMHIGLLNMMPDSALQATERQFFRLVGESNQIAQLYVHPFTLPEISRDADTTAYIKQHYTTFEALKAEGLDALIITGANIANPDLTQAPFWEPLQEIMGWAWDNVTSTLCSCLATHAVMQFRYHERRQPLGKKLWGVYGHRVLNRTHPLVRGVNTVFNVPHSRFNAISQEQFERAGLQVLANSPEAGAHIAVSPDGFRLICFQGHPEYDTISLYKEYTREVGRYVAGERKIYPPVPVRYFSKPLQKSFGAYKAALQNGERPAPPFDDTMMREALENSWRDSARSIIANWIGLVYQTTHVERAKQFMDGINPMNPLKGL